MVLKNNFTVLCVIVVNINFQPFCVGMFIGRTMAQLSASDVGRGTARGRGQGQGRGRGCSTMPPCSQVPIPLEDIKNYVNHGWWITARRETDAVLRDLTYSCRSY